MLNKILLISTVLLCLLTLIGGTIYSLETRKQIESINISVKNLSDNLKSVESKQLESTSTKLSSSDNLNSSKQVLPNQQSTTTLTQPSIDSLTPTLPVINPSLALPPTDNTNSAPPNQVKPTTPANSTQPVEANVWESKGDVFTVWSVFSLNANLFSGNVADEQIKTCTNIRPLRPDCGLSYQLLFNDVIETKLQPNDKVRVWGKYRWLENDPKNQTYQFYEITKLEKI